MNRIYGLATRLKQIFGTRVQKIPLDFGFTCPNRDGKISSKGCIFCSPEGAGSGMHAKAKSVPEQWEHWINKLSGLHGANLFLAYLQSYSNTYCTAEELREALSQLEGLDRLVGLCIGTRPDCVDLEKIKVIKELNLTETWLELGLQSSNDDTLKRINRGHTAKSFADACMLAESMDLQVCAHVIAGLPGEGEKEFLESIEFINKLPVRGIKLHNLFVGYGTPLHDIYESGGYTPLERSEYVEMLIKAISMLRQDIVIHRLRADPVPGELIAPDWAWKKRDVINEINRQMKRLNVWQGCARKDSPNEPPSWFNAEDKSPF